MSDMSFKRWAGALVALVAMAACSGEKGTNGSNGTNGTDGTNALVRVEPEAAGTHCPYGGVAVRSGLDANANGALDPGEVTSTSYVCGGADRVYAASAYILSQAKIVPDDATSDARLLAAVRTPDRDGFIPDPRVHAMRCRHPISSVFACGVSGRGAKSRSRLRTS